MQPSQPAATLFVPDGLEPAAALGRTTHLGVGAHPDDLEFMTWHGILECYRNPDRWFCGVVVTDGARSPRAEGFAGLSDEQMRKVRESEQREAATIGDYGALAMLGFSSAAIRPRSLELDRDLDQLLAATRPEVVYTHNPADKHETHVAVCLHVLRALRRMPVEQRPCAVFGCEVWRGLDWMRDDEDKRVFDVGGREVLFEKLMGVFESQIAGGKRYDLATLGRRRANATYQQPRETDSASLAELAMDLTPLVTDPSLSVRDHVLGLIARFRDEVSERLGALEAGAREE
ncbi:MAG TPA: PIG-L family deacetylase [Myxococcales bacterium]|jgi:LmbE family N-acetylglucosaminyl deacetylase|nr:PIG-L family deacetylase [Myxococcales bacterium]